MFRFHLRRTPAPRPVADRQLVADSIRDAVMDPAAEVTESGGTVTVRTRSLTARIAQHTSRAVDLSHVILRKPQYRGS